MIEVGDLVEDNDYAGFYGYVIAVVNSRTARSFARGLTTSENFIRNCHVKFFNDTDEDTVIIEADRLTRIG